MLLLRLSRPLYGTTCTRANTGRDTTRAGHLRAVLAGDAVRVLRVPYDRRDHRRVREVHVDEAEPNQPVHSGGDDRRVRRRHIRLRRLDHRLRVPPSIPIPFT